MKTEESKVGIWATFLVTFIVSIQFSVASGPKSVFNRLGDHCSHSGNNSPALITNITDILSPLPSLLCSKDEECNNTNLRSCKSGFIPWSENICLSSFNTSCINTSCSAKADLFCDDDTKLCRCSQGKTFSPRKLRCLAEVGTNCSEHTNCTDNAFCMNSVKCNCCLGFSPDLEGKCRRKYMSPCNSSKAESDLDSCNSKDFLSCIDKKCTCDDTKLYDGPRGQCVSIVGEKCNQRIKNITISSAERLLQCVENSVCTNGKCVCLKDMTFSQKQKKCFLLVGKNCTNSIDCTANAWCDRVDGKCRCKKRFSPNAIGKCFHIYNETCEVAKGRGIVRDKTSFVYSCNAYEFLACKEGKCKCEDDKVWDFKQSRCVSPVRGYCDLEQKSGKNMLQCVTGSICNPTVLKEKTLILTVSPINKNKTVALSSIPGKCFCSKGLLEIANRTCSSSTAQVSEKNNSSYAYGIFISFLAGTVMGIVFS